LTGLTGYVAGSVATVRQAFPVDDGVFGYDTNVYANGATTLTAPSATVKAAGTAVSVVPAAAGSMNSVFLPSSTVVVTAGTVGDATMVFTPLGKINPGAQISF